MQESMSLKYEPASEPLQISAKWLFLKSEVVTADGCPPTNATLTRGEICFFQNLATKTTTQMLYYYHTLPSATITFLPDSDHLSVISSVGTPL